MNPKVPISFTLQFIWGYIGCEEPEVQFNIVANLLMRFLSERVPPEEHAAAMQAILDTVPIAQFVNMPTAGGMQ